MSTGHRRLANGSLARVDVEFWSCAQNENPRRLFGPQPRNRSWQKLGAQQGVAAESR
jgi:hypothetical protein